MCSSEDIRCVNVLRHAGPLSAVKPISCSSVYWAPDIPLCPNSLCHSTQWSTAVFRTEREAFNNMCWKNVGTGVLERAEGQTRWQLGKARQKEAFKISEGGAMWLCWRSANLTTDKKDGSEATEKGCSVLARTLTWLAAKEIAKQHRRWIVLRDRRRSAFYPVFISYVNEVLNNLMSSSMSFFLMNLISGLAERPACVL